MLLPAHSLAAFLVIYYSPTKTWFWPHSVQRWKCCCCNLLHFEFIGTIDPLVQICTKNPTLNFSLLPLSSNWWLNHYSRILSFSDTSTQESQEPLSQEQVSQGVVNCFGLVDLLTVSCGSAERHNNRIFTDIRIWSFSRAW